MTQQVITGSALELSSLLERNSVHCVVTSPPYFGQRVYGDSPDEIGRGSLSEYIEDIVNVGVQIRHVLKPNGVFWLNIGDTSSKSGGAGGDYNAGGKKEGQTRYRQGHTGLARAQLCLVPFRVAEALQADGWLVRQVIVWNKQSLRPEDMKHVQRPLFGWEPILMLTQRKPHKFYPNKLTEKGNVWTFPPSRGNGHSAPFPDELARRCIECSTRRGDIVLDPFAGSGTTVRVASEMERHGIGVELYPHISKGKKKA